MTKRIAQKTSTFFKIALLFIFSTGALFLGFYKNQWGVADQAWFQNFQRDSESLVIGRLVKSRQDGIFSSAGFPGLGDNLPIEGQYGAYIHPDSFHGYEPYKSQIGFQGMLFSFLDRISPFEPSQNLRLFYGLTALLSALALSAVILWLYTQFGLLTAGVVFLSTLLSHWLTVFGRNLWWSTWAFYVPMIICLYYLTHEEKNEKHSNFHLTLLVSLGVFIKCLFNGYEYITTTLVMLAVPVVYYGIRERWTVWAFFKRLLYIQLGSLISIFISLMILANQLSFIEGNYLDGLKYIINTLRKRTSGNPALYPEIYQESLRTDTLAVVSRYTHQVIIDFNNLIHTDQKWLMDAFSIRFMDIIILFLLATVLALALLRMKVRLPIDKAKTTALIAGTWFAILAPLSWFVIFKSHSYIHTHMNAITWHMPFTIFGFALIGFVGTQLFSNLRKET